MFTLEDEKGEATGVRGVFLVVMLEVKVEVEDCAEEGTLNKASG